MDLKDLKVQFPPEDIEWRISRAGLKNGTVWAYCLAYVTNRAIQERLDEVVGEENWKNTFSQAPDGGILCGIGIKCGDEWVFKYDGAENTAFEAVKGGLSGAMKRAGVQWGIGRYLYNLTESRAIVGDGGLYYCPAKKDKMGKEIYPAFYWSPPPLPKWALPVKKLTAEQMELEDKLSEIVSYMKTLKLKPDVKNKYGIEFKAIENMEQAIGFLEKVKKEQGVAGLVQKVFEDDDIPIM
jgi:hypothetical protein